ncbi:MAG: type II toxin-antitoxin system VapC family toxin [Planctomycetes bacterium]|nr:type II toxin-antitoxin system VapC family toxin [Planctomycetota bacterium]
MRFWDTSALVPLFVEEPTTAELRSWVEDDVDICVWAMSDVEARSAIARRARSGGLSWREVQELGQRFDAFMKRVHVVSLLDTVKLRAKRLLAIHDLRAADSLQLAAALATCADDPAGYEFVTLDQRLAEAARREGFTVRP